jgi:hypothetical protein
MVSSFIASERPTYPDGLGINGAAEERKVVVPHGQLDEFASATGP